MKKLIILSIFLFASHILYSQEKYAILIASHHAETEKTSKNSNHSQFWIETYLMWEKLQNQGYSPQNIYVFFDNGYDYQSPSLADRYKPDTGIVITYDAALLENISQLLYEFKEGSEEVPELSILDELYFWTYEKFSSNKTHIQIYDGAISKEELEMLMNPLNSNIILDINTKY